MSLVRPFFTAVFVELVTFSTASNPSTPSRALSYTVCRSICAWPKQHSDLTAHSAQRFWEEQMLRGQIVGIGGGPSETLNVLS